MLRSGNLLQLRRLPLCHVAFLWDSLLMETVVIESWVVGRSSLAFSTTPATLSS